MPAPLAYCSYRPRSTPQPKPNSAPNAMGITELAIGILTSDRSRSTRLHAQQMTWLNQVT